MLIEAWNEDEKNNFFEIQNRHYDDWEFKNHNEVYYETREFNLFLKI